MDLGARLSPRDILTVAQNDYGDGAPDTNKSPHNKMQPFSLNESDAVTPPPLRPQHKLD